MVRHRLGLACAVAVWTLGAVAGCHAPSKPAVSPVHADTAFGRAILGYSSQVNRMRRASTLDVLDVDGALQGLGAALDEVPYVDRCESVSDMVDLVQKRVGTHELFAPGADDRTRMEATQQMLELVTLACVRLADEPYRTAPEVRHGCVVLHEFVKKLDPGRSLQDQRVEVLAAFDQANAVLVAMDDALHRGIVRRPVEGEALIAR